MKIFVTGGAGYIGSVCTEELLNAGHDVAVYDDLSEGHRAAVDARAKFILGDPGIPNNILTHIIAAQPDAILHFAASALVGESMAKPGKYFANNVVNGLQFLEAAIAAGVKKFVFSSTCATYGLPPHVPISEATPQNPINPYGESKLMFERLLRWYYDLKGLEFAAFRFFNAAGASERFGEHHRCETHLVPNVIKVALGQSPHCEIFGTDYPTADGTCVRDYVHVRDIAQAHILALESGASGFYNLGNGDGYSVAQVIEACEKITAKKIPVVRKPRRPGDPPVLIASAKKAKSELGWSPRFKTLESIIASAWAWHSTHPSGYGE